MNRILLLSEPNTDLSTLILNRCPGAVRFDLTAEVVPFENFDAVCVLGGTSEKPFIIPAHLRLPIEKMRAAGKPVFCEFVSSIGCVYSADPNETTHHRLVFSDEHARLGKLSKGSVLDGHRNSVIPYYFVPGNGKPILTYHDHVCAHDRIDMDYAQFRSGRWALWMSDDNTMIASFRLCNFNRARLAPRDYWHQVLTGIIEFLSGEPAELTFPAPVCRHEPAGAVTSASDIDEAVRRGLAWFRNAHMLQSNGRKGVLEGFSHHISARDGYQYPVTTIRADCTGETGGAFFMDYLRSGSKDSYEVFRNTQDFCFDRMQVKDGAHRGMLRWTEQAWEVCYQDDVARAIIPTLLCQNFGKGSAHFADAVDALTYLVDTTGANGLRVARTDVCHLSPNFKEELQAGEGTPSAHYNAFYHAALLLATRAGADKRFAEIAVKGLSAIMALYPNTQRETSETEEMCRLILPLSLLYEYTGDPAHYGWLNRVTEDLQKVRHPSGGYAEWDTGYKAACARNDHGECALLANNGDPVVDLLYSNNWLPMGFAYAYLVTGEERFHTLWADIASFMLTCQIHSDDPLLDGAWTRAMDMNRMESYGVPHDIGWAPCCIESGWTVGEILTGLQFMTVAERTVAEKA